jgi:hypothetical protein
VHQNELREEKSHILFPELIPKPYKSLFQKVKWSAKGRIKVERFGSTTLGRRIKVVLAAVTKSIKGIKTGKRGAMGPKIL